MEGGLRRLNETRLSRRGFLQLGLGGAAALTVLNGTVACTRAAPEPADGYHFLTDAHVGLFSVLLPAVAGPAWPHPPQAAPLRQAALQHIDANCHRLGEHNQKQMRQLLDLLTFPPFRRFAAGLRTDWPDCTAAEVQEFLARWQRSRVSLFNGGHRALVKFCASAFWGQPETWSAAGYPGPPAFALKALQA